jgi:hypothetical protein
MAEGGITVKKTWVFAACACVSFIMFIVFMVLVICTLQMHGVVQEVCKRMDDSTDLMCRVQGLGEAMSRRVQCDQTCKHDWTSLTGGAGGAPGAFGVGAWQDEDDAGVPIPKGDSSSDWQSIVRTGTKCQLTEAQDIVWQAQVDCVCDSTKVQVMLKAKEGTASVEGCCTVVTWEGGAPYIPSSDVTLPCLYIPKTGTLRNELSIETTKTAEINRCQHADERFNSGGHYFVIYMPICILWCWCAIVSVIGYIDQKYQAFRRFRNKNSKGDKMGYEGYNPEEPSAAVMAAQQWAQDQAGPEAYDANPAYAASGQEPNMYGQQMAMPDQNWDVPPPQQDGYGNQV